MISPPGSLFRPASLGYSVHRVNTKPEREDALTLEILDVIERRQHVSQRHLARHLDVALGLANSYLKRCVRKGFVKVREAPANRYAYYLTPKGFAEKGRLTVRYLAYSFSFYREAGAACREVLDLCRAHGWQRLILCGVSDLAEIATLRAIDAGLSVVGYYDPNAGEDWFLDKPVWRDWDSCGVADAWVLTDLRAPQASFDEIKQHVGAERVLVPAVLRLNSARLT